ncbi:MAG: hypothetical protein M3069_33180 [Chloroflexota bacterium]|nr:hypothetical protein [Chloroflexota bacterium]
MPTSRRRWTLYPILPLFFGRQLCAPGRVGGIIEGIVEALEYVLQGLSGWTTDCLKRDKSSSLSATVGLRSPNQSSD